MTPERYQRVIALFEAACQRSGDACSSFLNQVCAGDDLLRREVEDMLAADRKSRGLIEEPLPGLGDATRTFPGQPAATLDLSETTTGHDLPGPVKQAR